MPRVCADDYLKVDFSDEAKVGEWVWFRVDRCDDEKRGSLSPSQ
jgi:hypothetical protein